MKFFKKLSKLNIFIVRRVAGQSMIPALKPGQIVLAIKLCSKNLSGKVVIVNYDSREIIKRVKWCNNQKMFIVGDNLEFSQDSRLFGPIDKDYCLAQVIWPRV